MYNRSQRHLRSRASAPLRGPQHSGGVRTPAACTGAAAPPTTTPHARITSIVVAETVTFATVLLLLRAITARLNGISGSDLKYQGADVYKFRPFASFGHQTDKISEDRQHAAANTPLAASPFEGACADSHQQPYTLLTTSRIGQAQ